MASCDDDFSLLDDHHHTPNSSQPSAATGAHPPPYEIATFDPDSDPFDSEPDPNSLSGKRSIDRDDVHSGTSKRTRMPSAGEYRKDREEWSDSAIACLLEAYSEKFVQLNRGNLRGRDWEEVAVIVSERCENQSKSVEQCKNKVDNLKKRFKLERHRLSNGGVMVSHWPWFKQMEQIVGNSIAAKAAAEEEKAGVGSLYPARQSKRLGTLAANLVGQVMNPKKASTNLRWRRVVFKISGGALAGTTPNNIDPKVAMLIAREVSVACRVGVEVAIVVGGRNFFCGDTWVTSTGSDRCTAYQIGCCSGAFLHKYHLEGRKVNSDLSLMLMMATVMNSVLLQSALEKLGVQARVQSAFSMPEVAEPYSRQRAIRHLEKGRVVIFGGIGAGTGNPLFSTDTAAALRASEIHADVVLKGTNSDGVFVFDSNDISSEHISFSELASRGTSSMDMMALTFCEENGIPVVIFNLHEPGNISRALCGEQVGVLIDQTGPVG
ncbi:homeodomain-like [Striga asiatica]|uniref:UMP kinase n=1 Tax=Striga asiatica TaxID=4170 RepID=A0A5A7QK28_STRAF|nr:homeodomain-like [Striga asiatica]